MSHFSVMVIGDNVEQQLAPFHEFECTGTDDQYVQSIDRTDEAREEFEGRTETRLRAPDGVLHDYFDKDGNWKPEFSKPDPSAGDWDKGRRTRHIPDGFEEVEVPAAQVESFAEWVAGWYGWSAVPHGEQPDLAGDHKYGYVLLDASGNVTKCIDRTNPYKRWDWWVVGGRWSGKLLKKDGTRCDSAFLGDIDIAGMRDAKAKEWGDRWDSVNAITGGQEWRTWESVREAHPGDIDAARKAYHEQPAIAALNKNQEFRFWDGLDEFRAPRDAYVQQARDGAMTALAIVKDSTWFERGTMGWWGVVHDEKDAGEWYRQCAALLDGLPPTTLITIVDCHI